MTLGPILLSSFLIRNICNMTHDYKILSLILTIKTYVSDSLSKMDIVILPFLMW